MGGTAQEGGGAAGLSNVERLNSGRPPQVIPDSLAQIVSQILGFDGATNRQWSIVAAWRNAQFLSLGGSVSRVGRVSGQYEGQGCPFP